MIAEAFNAIQEMTKKSVVCEIKTQGHVMTIRQPGELPEFTLAPPETPRRSIDRLNDFCAFLATRKEMLGKPQVPLVPMVSREGDGPDGVGSPFVVSGEGGVVYYNESFAEYIEHPHDPRGLKVIMKLVKTPVYQALVTMRPMDPVAFYKFLRVILKGCINPDILDVFRTIRFESGQALQAKIGQGAGRAQYGKDMLEETMLDNGAPIPEELIITVKPFLNIDHGEALLFSIDVNTRDGLIGLTPYPLEMQKVIDGALDVLSKRVTAAGVQNYYGTCNSIDNPTALAK